MNNFKVLAFIFLVVQIWGGLDAMTDGFPETVHVSVSEKNRRSSKSARRSSHSRAASRKSSHSHVAPHHSVRRKSLIVPVGSISGSLEKSKVVHVGPRAPSRGSPMDGEFSSSHGKHVRFDGLDKKDGDVDQISDQLKVVDLTKETTKETTEEVDEKLIDSVLMLYRAIVKPDLKEVERLIQTTNLKHFESPHSTSSSTSKKSLTSPDYITLRDNFFTEHEKILGEKIPCSPLWLAVEFAIDAKKTNDKSYAERLAIVTVLAEKASKTAKREFQSLRKISPPRWYSWFCVPCGPWISASYCTVGGGKLMHRAAQANNVEILRILFENKFDINALDDDEWSPHMYAVWFECEDAEQFLRRHGAKIRQYNCASCCYGADCCQR